MPKAAVVSPFLSVVTLGLRTLGIRELITEFALDAVVSLDSFVIRFFKVVGMMVGDHNQISRGKVGKSGLIAHRVDIYFLSLIDRIRLARFMG